MTEVNEIKFKNERMKNLFVQGLKRYETFQELKRYGFRSESVILDHGCGSGAEIAQIAPRHEGYLIGTEIDVDRLIVARMLIRRCNKTRRNVDFVLADSTHLPFSEKQFDFVLSSFVLEHIRKREIALEEMYRVLKDEGFAIISLDTYLRCIKRCVVGYFGYLLLAVSSRKRKRFVVWLKSYVAEKNKSINERKLKRLELLFKRLQLRICILSYLFFPLVHGDYEHAAEEFVANLPSSWVKLVKLSSFEKFDTTSPSAGQRIGRFPGEIMIKAYKRKS